MRKLTLITPTGGRWFALELLILWMFRQTFTGRVRWIIVNDVDPDFTAPEMPDNWSVEVIMPRPRWKAGDNTQARNLLAALETIGPDERVAIIEDDDYYATNWLETVDAMLENAELVGQIPARYYNVKLRKGKQLNNLKSAALSSCAMRGDALRLFREICGERPKGIDMELWNRHPDSQSFDGCRVIGIKGLPGRAGIGIGHKPNFRGVDDRDGVMLRGWIGEDFRFYL